MDELERLKTLKQVTDLFKSLEYTRTLLDFCIFTFRITRSNQTCLWMISFDFCHLDYKKKFRSSLKGKTRRLSNRSSKKLRPKVWSKIWKKIFMQHKENSKVKHQTLIKLQSRTNQWLSKHQDRTQNLHLLVSPES